MRNRSMAIVVRDNKILMEKVFYYNRMFYTVPGGGIEDGETPEDAAIRELKEECLVDGTIVKKLTQLITKEGNTEHVFEVRIPDDQDPSKGYDPEQPMDDQAIKEVKWMTLDELSEKDRAFLFSYGIMGIESFGEEVISWGDTVSYPTKKEKLTINEYQIKAMTTLNPALNKKDVLINSVMGLCGESGEAIDIVKKWMAQGHELDKEHIAKELGDIAWYLAEAATVLEVPLEDILQANLDKLRKRYPDGFDSKKSIVRLEGDL